MGQYLRGSVNHLLGHISQPIRMADRNQALHAQGAGACSDAFELGNANLAGFMEVDIGLHPMALRDAEDYVQLCFGIAVQRRRVDAADHLHTLTHGSFQDFGGTGAGHHARLGKGHQFDVDQVLPVIPCLENGVQMAQPSRGIHVHVAAHGERAIGGGLADQGIGAVEDWWGAGQFAFFHRQALAQGGDVLVRAPAVANEALVRWMWPSTKPGRASRPSVDGIGCGDGGVLWTDVGDTSVLHGDVQGQAICVDGVDELTVVHGWPFIIGAGSTKRTVAGDGPWVGCSDTR